EQSVTGPLEEVPADRSLDMRKAVPSWQHNLDWDNPEEEEAPQAEAGEEDDGDEDDEPTPDELAADALLSSGEEPFEFQSKGDLLDTIGEVLKTGVHGLEEEEEAGASADDSS